jgi:hypothetical protein
MNGRTLLITRSVASQALRSALLILIMVAFFLASPAAGYIVVLKDGSRISTRKAPDVQGERVILILPSGTQAFYQTAEIDFPATKLLNKTDYGTAKLIGDGGEITQVGKKESLDDDKRTLGELFGQRGLALPEPKRRRSTGQSGGGEEIIPTTAAGYVDLQKLPREPLANEEIGRELRRYLQGQGIEDVRVYKGSESAHALVEIIAASEASVFKAMKDASNGLVQITERFPGQISAFELLLVTSDQIRAGQFLLTAELANLLVTGALDSPSFFLRYVEF